MLILNLFEYIFEEEDADTAIYIKSGYLFHADMRNDSNFGDAVIGPNDQYQVYSKNIGYEKYIKKELMKFRGQIHGKEEEEEIVPKLSEYQLKKIQQFIIIIIVYI